MSGQGRGRQWYKYSPEFKAAAVDRMQAESATAIARELGIRCKFLYAWRATGKGSQAVAARPARVEEDREQQQIQQLQTRISELERLTGKQAAELDFFAAALRSVQETRRKSGARSGEASTK